MQNLCLVLGTLCLTLGAATSHEPRAANREISAGARLVLAERGKAADYTIVLPREPSASQTYAAEELQRYVAEMTGVTLPIASVTDRVEKAIYLRTTDAYGNDGFRFQAKPPHFAISGSAIHGTLFGVYHLLENYGGCDWFSSSTTNVPVRVEFSVPADLDDTQMPAFVCRDTSWNEAVNDPALAARLKLHGPHMWPPQKFGKNQIKFDWKFPNSHTFKILVPPEEYFEKHPEYFAEVNGFREKAQLCLSNPEVRRIAKHRLLGHVRTAYPKSMYFGVSQNDNNSYCTCPKCRALDEREGTPAASIVDFVNDIAAEVEKVAPDAIVTTLAYMYSRKPPKTMKLRKNVMVILCGDQCDYSKPMYESQNGESRGLVRDLAAWRQIATHLLVWDYTADFQYFNIAHPNIRTLGPNLKFYRDNGVTHVYEEGHIKAPHGDLAELRLWLIAHFLWNPNQPLEPLLDRFYTGYYGAAAPYARQYVDLMHSYPRNERVIPLHMWGEIAPLNPPREFYEAADRLWRQAEEAVKDDPIRRENVKWARHPTDWSRVMMCNLGGRLEVTRHPEYAHTPRFAELQAAAKRAWARYRENPRIEFTGEVWQLREWAKRRIRHFADMDPASVAASDRVQAEESALIFKPNDQMKLVDDATASGGKALRFGPRAKCGSAVLYLNDVHVDAEATYRLRVRVKVEKASPDAKGEAFRVAVCGLNPGWFRPDELKSFGVRAEEAGEGYVWYEAFTGWKPDVMGHLRFGIGAWDGTKSNFNPCAAAALIDAIEIVRE